ncbi:MAG: sigma D regulator [Gammaproteobacteria bacterium]|nr:sigma D regulator [Gammaproteobacteria bacterium]
MLQQFEESQRRFGGQHDAIDSWLEERREVLLRYCQLSGISSLVEALPRDRALPAPAQVHAFCDVLVDYVSAGHFEIYQRLLGELEQDSRASQEAGRLYPAIIATTDAVLSFDERYGERGDQELRAEFDADLSRLGEQLASRFELEDELMALLRLPADAA